MDVMSSATRSWAFSMNCLPSLSHWGQNHVAEAGNKPGLPVLTSDLLQECSAQVAEHSNARAWLVFSLWCPGHEM